MQIFFRNKKLQKTCNSDKEMRKTFGPARAEKLGRRLTELKAADHLDQISRLPPTRCHELSGNRKGQFSVDLGHPYRLIFIPANEPVPVKADGGLDLEKITEIEILEVVDYH